MHAGMTVTLTTKPAFLMTDTELEETRHAEIEHARQVTLWRHHVHLVKGRE
jgi:hypothetical protein